MGSSLSFDSERTIQKRRRRWKEKSFREDVCIYLQPDPKCCGGLVRDGADGDAVDANELGGMLRVRMRVKRLLIQNE